MDNNLLRKGRKIVASLTLAMVMIYAMGLTAVVGAFSNPSASSSDPYSWSYDAFTYLVDKGVFDDNSDMRPSATTNRAEMATVVARLMDIEGSSNAKEYFDDVPSWAATSVNGLVDAGVIDEQSNRMFRSSDDVTRSEMAKMLVEAYGWDMPSSSECETYGSDFFKDVVPASQGGWYECYVAKLVMEEVVLGYEDQTFRPGNPIVRAETAVMVYKADTLDMDDDDDDDQPTTGDQDADGIDDDEDNCPNDANEDQIDSDNDGQGDDCDEDTSSEATLTVEADTESGEIVIPSDASSVTAMTLTLSASDEDDVIVSGMEFDYDYTYEDDIEEVRVLWEGEVLGSGASITNGTAQINFGAEDITIEAGESVELDVEFGLDDEADDNRVHSFNIASEDSIYTNASEVDGDFPVESSVFRTNNEEIGSILFEEEDFEDTDVDGEDDSTDNVDVGEEDATLGEFELTSQAEESQTDFAVERIRLDLTTDLDADCIEDLYLETANGEELTDVIESASEGEVVFNFTEPYMMEKGDSDSFRVKGTVVCGAQNDELHFEFEDDSDLLAYVAGAKYQYGVNVEGEDTELGTYVVQAGDINLQKASGNPSDTSVATESTDVVGVAGRFTTGAPLMVDELFTLTVEYVLQGLTEDECEEDTTLSDTIEDRFTDVKVYMVSGGKSEIVAGPEDEPTTLTAGSYASTECSTTATYEFDDTFYIPAGSVELLGALNVESSAEDDDEFTMSFEDIDNTSHFAFKYNLPGNDDEVEADDITGSIEGGTFTVTQAGLTITESSTLVTGDNIVKGAQDVTLAEFQVQVQDVIGVELNEITLTATDTNSTSASRDVQYIENVRLYDLEGNQLGDDDEDFEDGTTGTVTFEDLEIELAANDTFEFRVVADISDSAPDGAKYTIKVAAATDVELTDENGNEAAIDNFDVNETTGATLDIVESGTLVIAHDDSENSDAAEIVVPTGNCNAPYSCYTMAGAFEFELNDDDAIIHDLIFTAENGLGATANNSVYSSFVLKNEVGEVIAGPKSIIGGEISFEGMEYLMRETGGAQTLIVYTKVNPITNEANTGERLQLSIEEGNYDIDSSSSTNVDLDVTVDDAADEGSDHSDDDQLAIKAFASKPTVSTSNTTGTLTLLDGVEDELLEFTVTSASTGPIYLYKITVDVVAANSALRVSDPIIIDDTSDTTSIGSATVTGGGSDSEWASGESIVFTFANPVEVSGSKKFYVRATATDNITSGVADLTLELAGNDDTDPSASAGLAASSVTGDFVWGDGSADDADSLTAAQWTNGYQIDRLGVDQVHYEKNYN